MESNVQLLVIVALVVLVAVVLGRRLIVRWGNKSATIGHSGEQVIRAGGEGSSVERVKMQSGRGGKQEISAKGGGSVSDAEIDSRVEGAGSAGDPDAEPRDGT